MLKVKTFTREIIISESEHNSCSICEAAAGKGHIKMSTTRNPLNIRNKSQTELKHNNPTINVRSRVVSEEEKKKKKTVVYDVSDNYIFTCVNEDALFLIKPLTAEKQQKPMQRRKTFN